MSQLKELLIEYKPTYAEMFDEMSKINTLSRLVLYVMFLVKKIGVDLIQEELMRRGTSRHTWPKCDHCGKRIESKGQVWRSVLTLLGMVRWSRKVGRCPNRCKGHQIAPLDQELGLGPYQKISDEIKWMGCLLAVHMPFHTCVLLLNQLTGVSISSESLWNWVQAYGRAVADELDREVEALREGHQPRESHGEKDVGHLPLVIGADGVMVPFRPENKSPKGKTKWLEVKVAILARLGIRVSREGENTTELKQRRLVAVLGTIEQLREKLWMEALRQNIRTAKRVIWLSDGGRCLWGVFKDYFGPLGAIGILDFYHAAQNLWKGAKARFDGRTKMAREWFEKVRHQLRHGQEQTVLVKLKKILSSKQLHKEVSDEERKTLQNVHDYLTTHQDHIQYKQFKDEGYPIGSGIVESVCKWLIQQRVKGVGMRWSTTGFNNLLHLRLAWVNERFDDFFFAPPNA